MWAVLVVGVAWATDPFGFSTGEHPVDLDTTSDEPVWTDASECADCHQEAAEQWSASRHSVAWTNDLMQAGFVAEARLFCVYCHAPSTAQVAEVTANMATYRALSPTAPPHGAAPGALLPEPKAEEGISCVVCHLRNGEVLSANPPDPESPHPIRTDPTFGTEAACVTCHQFPAPSFVDGRTIPSDQPMQATVAEWEAWRAETGHREDCTDCHMPDGDHRMPGVHDHEQLRSAIRAKVRGRGANRVLRIEAVDVGHAVPTGDLFRRLTVEVRRADTDWTTIEVLGRRFIVDDSGPVPIKRQVADTRPRPEHPIDVPLSDPLLSGIRVRIHLGGTHDEMRGLVPIEALVFTVWEAPLRPR